MSVFTEQYWINKGYDTDEANKKRKEFHSKFLNTSNVDFWVNKGLSLDEAIEKVKEIMIKKSNHFNYASKESLKIFEPIFLKYPELDIRIGSFGKNELHLYDTENKKIYFYDFSIPELQLIFEYHGERYHPHDSINGDELKNWFSYTSNRKYGQVDGVEARAKDNIKKELALVNGYDYYVIWSSDNKKQSIEKIINIIDKKYEDKKNN